MDGINVGKQQDTIKKYKDQKIKLHDKYQIPISRIKPRKPSFSHQKSHFPQAQLHQHKQLHNSTIHKNEFTQIKIIRKLFA